MSVAQGPKPTTAAVRQEERARAIFCAVRASRGDVDQVAAVLGWKPETLRKHIDELAIRGTVDRLLREAAEGWQLRTATAAALTAIGMQSAGVCVLTGNFPERATAQKVARGARLEHGEGGASGDGEWSTAAHLLVELARHLRPYAEELARRTSIDAGDMGGE